MCDFTWSRSNRSVVNELLKAPLTEAERSEVIAVAAIVRKREEQPVAGVTRVRVPMALKRRLNELATKYRTNRKQSAVDRIQPAGVRVTRSQFERTRPDNVRAAAALEAMRLALPLAPPGRRI